MNREKILLFFAINILLFFIAPTHIHAYAEAPSPAGFDNGYSDNGSTMYTYETGCQVVTVDSVQDSDWQSRSTIQKPRSVIVFDGITIIDTIVIHFHGKNFMKNIDGNRSKESVPSPTAKDLVDLYSNPPGDKEGSYTLSEDIQSFKNANIKAAVFMPRLFQSGAQSQKLNKNEFDCFYTEAMEKLRGIPGISVSDNPRIILSGHSAGGNTIRSYVQDLSYTASASYFFDACYGSFCESAVKTGKTGNTFIYYTTANNGATKQDSEKAKNADSTRVKLVETSLGHDKVLDECFGDPLDNTLCNGKGKLQGENPFNESDAVGQAVNSITTPDTPFFDEINLLLLKPQPKIKIPTVSFSSTHILQGADGNTYLSVPYLGEYISQLYKYGIIVMGIISVVLIIRAGLMWVMSGGKSENVQKAQKNIVGAVIGIVLISTSYTILYMINPELVQFRNLKILYIKTDLFDPSDKVDTDLNIYDSSFVLNNYGLQVAIDDVTDLKTKSEYNCTPGDIREVALAFASQGICMQSKTCAITASYLLNRAGCKKKNGSPFTGIGSSKALGPLAMTEMGWVKYPGDISKLSDEQLKRLPVGILWKPKSHSALHIGNGDVVESSYSRTPYKQFWPKEVFSQLITNISFEGDVVDAQIDQVLMANGICPISPIASHDNPTVCKSCALIPRYDPSLGPLGSGNRNHYIFKSENLGRIKKFQDLYYNPAWTN